MTTRRSKKMIDHPASHGHRYFSSPFSSPFSSAFHPLFTGSVVFGCFPSARYFCGKIVAFAWFFSGGRAGPGRQCAAVGVRLWVYAAFLPRKSLCTGAHRVKGEGGACPAGAAAGGRRRGWRAHACTWLARRARTHRHTQTHTHTHGRTRRSIDRGGVEA